MGMEAFEFTVIAGGLDPHADGFEDRFFEAGCDDATVSLQKGAIILDFTRDAVSFDDAVNSAIKDVEKAGARVERIEPDHLVSLTDIAKRSNLSKAAISNYAAGDRCHGFPPPFSRVTTESPLWDWAVVALWLCENGKISGEAVRQARFVRDANFNISVSRMRSREPEAA
jgi:hypothetical protein